MNDFIARSPNYLLMNLNENELKIELSRWNREDLINWLKWNDSNGIYTDKESLDELGNIMTYEEGVEIIIRQIIQK
jgi:hypothetical protein